MPKCAFLTSDGLEDFFIYDALAKPHLLELGWTVNELCWRDKSNNYDDYDLVVVRSTWDYQQHYKEFIEVIDRIDRSSATLENAQSLIRWNISKSYLQELQSKGINILPTIWCDVFCLQACIDSFKEFECDEIIIKPLISANADFTYRLTESFLHENFKRLESELQGREIMIQAFENSIIGEGEYSLFYFDGQYSHAINKRPCIGDFRVQEEHGGVLKAIDATEKMKSLSCRTINALPEMPLYARIDMLNTVRGLEIIELELIEPSLYFNMDDLSAQRFAKAMHNKWLKERHQ